MLGQAVLQPVLAATTEWPQAPPRQLISFLRIVIESARVSFTLNSASHLAWGSYSGLGALDCCKYSSSITDAIDGRFVKRPSYFVAKSSNLRLMKGSALSASARQCSARSLKNSLSTAAPPFLQSDQLKSALAAGLNERGITAPRDGNWRAVQVKHALARCRHGSK